MKKILDYVERIFLLFLGSVFGILVFVIPIYFPKICISILIVYIILKFITKHKNKMPVLRRKSR